MAAIPDAKPDGVHNFRGIRRRTILEVAQNDVE
jgi:hypothetical protein